VAHYTFDGQANDISGNGYNGQVSGATLTADRCGRPDRAYSFDGVDDYITTSYTQTNLTAYTFSAWVYISDPNQTQISIGQNRGPEQTLENPARSLTLYFDRETDGTFTLNFGLDGDHMLKSKKLSYASLLNQWVHVVGVWQGTANSAIEASQMKLYLNGVLAAAATPASVNSAGNAPVTGNGTLLIGRHQAWNKYFKGKLDDIRIYNRALSDAEVAQLHQQEKVCEAPPAPVPVAHYLFDGQANDASGNGYHGQVNGASLTADRCGRPNRAYAFDGVDDYITTPYTQTNLNAYSISAWVYITDPNQTQITISQNRGPEQTRDNPARSLTLYFEKDPADAYAFKLSFGLDGDHILKTKRVPYATLLNQWVHVAATWQGATGTMIETEQMNLYLNGSVVNQTTVYRDSDRGGTAPLTGGGTLRIGHHQVWNTYFKGKIDDIRIYDQALSGTEVAQLWQEEKECPADIADLILHYPFDGQANDASGNGYNGQVNGATLTTDRCGRPDRAFSFDGEDDYITTSYTQTNLTAYTFSTWVFVSDPNQTQITISQNRGPEQTRDNPARSLTLFFDKDTKDNSVFKLNFALDGDHILKAKKIPYTSLLNQWVQVVATWQGTDGAMIEADQMKIYLNGSLASEATIYRDSDLGGLAPLTGSGTLRIGHHQVWNKYFKGKLDDIRIYNRALSGGEVSQLYQQEVNCATIIPVSNAPITSARALSCTGVPQKVWDKSFGKDLFEELRVTLPTLDGGFVLGGTHVPYGIDVFGNPIIATKKDYLIIKIDAFGNKLWEKVLGGNDDDELFSIVPTLDGNYLLGGSSKSGVSGDKTESSRGGYDYWVVLVDGSGNKIWDKTVGGTATDNLRVVITTADGGFLLGGYSDSGAGSNNPDKTANRVGKTDYWTVKLDASGKKLWDKTYGGFENEVLTAITVAPDGGYLLGGYSDSNISKDLFTDAIYKSENSKGGNDYWVVKTDANGNKLWDKAFGGSTSDIMTSIVLTTDGGFLLGGGSESGRTGDRSDASRGSSDYWVVRINSNGQKLWDKAYGGTEEDGLTRILPAPDGGFLLGGYSMSNTGGDKSENSRGGSDFWFIKINSEGEKQWDRTLGGSGTDILYSIQVAADGGYLLGGTSSSDISAEKTTSFSGAEPDIWIVKLSDCPVSSYLATTEVSQSAVLMAYGCPGEVLWSNGQKGLFLRVNATQTTRYSAQCILATDNSDESGVLLFLYKAASPLTTLAQSKCYRELPQKLSDITLGGSAHEGLREILPTPDGGFLLAGTSSSGQGGDKSASSKGGADYWIVRVNAAGNKLWDKTFGGNGTDSLRAALLTADGGFLLGGTSNSARSGDKTETSKGNEDFWVIRIDAQGNKLWDKTFGGEGFDKLTSLAATTDGNFLLGGYSTSQQSFDKFENARGLSDYWLLKIDGLLGDKLWDKTYGGSATEVLSTIRVAADGTIFLAGTSNSASSGEKTEPSKGGYDFWVIKLNNQGAKLWDKTYGGSGNDFLQGFQPAPDNKGYVLAGTSYSGAAQDKTSASRGSADYWMLKINAEGTKQWDNSFGGSGFDQLALLLPTPDKGFLLGGTSASGLSGDKTQNSFGAEDYWIVKVDTTGKKQWDKTMGGTGKDQLFSAHSTSTGGYILGGLSESNANSEKTQGSKGGSDFWIIQLKGCTESTTASSCEGNPAVLQAFGCPGTVDWSSGGQGLFVHVQPGSTTQYTATCKVTGYNSNALATSTSPASAALSVTRDAETFTFKIESIGGPRFCSGSSMELKVKDAPTGSNVVQWLRNNSLIADETKISLTVKESGTYKATVENSKGCETTVASTTTAQRIDALQSVNSGPWSDARSWSDGCIPTRYSDITINKDHTIFLEGSLGEVNSMQLQGKLDFRSGGNLGTFNIK
jgi:hypothetical protein